MRNFSAPSVPGPPRAAVHKSHAPICTMGANTIIAQLALGTRVGRIGIWADAGGKKLILSLSVKYAYAYTTNESTMILLLVPLHCFYFNFTHF